MGTNKRILRSSCRMCHGVCQVLVHMEGERVVKVTGDPESPTSRGYICPKGAASPELLNHPDRLLYPLKRKGARGENKWKRISWEEALQEIVERIQQIWEESGTEYVGIGSGTGRPLIQFTRRFANALMTPNYVSHAHICYVPRQIAARATMGQLPVCDVYGHGGVMPACIMNWGCDIVHHDSADGMCGGMLRKAIKKAQKVILVDPRRISIADNADHWLQLRPGTDGALALAMINTIIADDLIDHEFVHQYTNGFDRLADHVRPFTPEWAAPITRVAAEDIRAAARTYAVTKPACIQWGQSLDTNGCNIQTARSLLILMAITGNVDVPGGDALWVPPEGVKNIALFASPEQRGDAFLPKEKKERCLGKDRFSANLWTQAPAFWDSVIKGDPYRVRAMWFFGANPLMTATQGLKIEKALRDLVENVWVSDVFMTPTAQLADIVLPAATWLEQDDVAYVHKIWCILARKKITQRGEVRDDRDVMIEVGRRLGLYEAFPWENLRDFHNWVLEDAGFNFEEFSEKGILVEPQRYRKHETEGFKTRSGKIELYSGTFERMGLSPLPEYREPPLSPVSTPDVARDYPLILMTGVKNKYFFHSEYLQLDSLRRHNPDPLIEIHPQTADALGILDGDWVWVETVYHRVQLRAKLWDGLQHDVVSAQHAWWFPEKEPPEYDWKRCNINLVFGDDGFDPETGAEPLKCYLCRVYKAEMQVNP